MEKRDYFTKKPIPEEFEISLGDGVYYDKRNLITNSLGMSVHVHNPKNVIDYFTGELLNGGQAMKFLGLNKKGKIEEYFTFDRYRLIEIRPAYKWKRKLYRYVLDVKTTKVIGYKESFYDGFFYDPHADVKISSRPVPYREFSLPKIPNTRKDKIKYGILSPTNLISEGKDYTIGYEIETSSGFIPHYVHKYLNICCVYDGSIRDDNGKKRVGGEYVTGVLKGDAGFKHLYEIMKELSKRCTINKTCSFHVHVGNFNQSKTTIVALYKLAQMVENEVFQMMPPSRSMSNHAHKMKKVNFTFNKSESYDMNIDRLYRDIFRIISLGKSPGKNLNRNNNHPAGDHCGFDTSTPRYWWVNFVPLLFNLKGPGNWTIEWRAHSATLNFTKAKNWSLIVQGLVYVAENYPKLVFDSKTFTLEKAMKLAYKGKGNYLSRYINERKEIFKERGKLVEGLEYSVDEVKKNSLKYSDAIWD